MIKNFKFNVMILVKIILLQFHYFIHLKYISKRMTTVNHFKFLLHIRNIK